MLKYLKKFIKKIDFSYRFGLFLLKPLNVLLSKILKTKIYPNSVLHISYMVHIPHLTVELLRKAGIKADYIAIGTSPVWNKSDYKLKVNGIYALGIVRLMQEMLILWRVAAKYEIIHLHFMMPLTLSGWDLPYLKSMGRKIVIHYRGCEVRDWQLNIRLHPKMNICQQCDYQREACSNPTVVNRRALAKKYGDLFLVTTPDLLDFAPEAIYLPFFTPQKLPQPQRSTPSKNNAFKIVHATNHPGIEGTDKIQEVVKRLQSKGYAIEFVFLKGVSYDRSLAEFMTADLAIGKMKMGYYANAQIESMSLGIPTITYVRPDFVTDELRQSGFILSSLDELESTLEYYLSHPDALQKKKTLARSSILKMHDNETLTQRLLCLYQQLKKAPHEVSAHQK